MNCISSLLLKENQELNCFSKTITNIAIITAVALIVIGTLAVLAASYPILPAFAFFGFIGGGVMIGLGALLISLIVSSICCCRLAYVKGDGEKPDAAEDFQGVQIENPPSEDTLDRTQKLLEKSQKLLDDSQKLLNGSEKSSEETENPSTTKTEPFSGTQFKSNQPGTGRVMEWWEKDTTDNKTGAPSYTGTEHTNVTFEELE